MELNKFIKTTRASSALFLVCIAFFIPFGATLRDIFVVLAVIALALNPAVREALKLVLLRPFMLAIAAFYVLGLLGCFWGSASWHEKWLVLEKFNKLLYLPFLIAGFQIPKIRKQALQAFLLAMSVVAALLICKALGVLHHGGDDPGKLFYNHILTGYMLAFAAYLSAVFAVKHSGAWRIVYGAAFGVLSYTVLFICTGRMGYLAYLVMMLVWFFQSFSKRQALALSVGFLCVFLASYSVNPTMKFLVHQANDDVTSYRHQTNKNTSLGLRAQFHLYAYELLKRHPWVGNGTGGFSALFKQDKPVPNWEQGVIWEPHSQYWLIAADYGGLGLLVYGLVLLALLWEIMQACAYRAIGFALLLSFIIGSLTDSLLLYSGTGYFFLFFFALCLGAVKNANTACSLADAADDPAHLLLQAKAGETQT